MKCTECSFENPPTMQYCGKCGALILENHCLQAGERKNASILFSDLSGYTALSSKLEPEYLLEILQMLYKEAERIITDHGGLVDKFIGDEVMAVFGVPEAHEDHPIRAVESALEIHYKISETSKYFMEKTVYPLTMHSGINTGLIVTEFSGNKFTSVTGNTVNLASRLTDLAGPDEIVVGPDTFSRTGGYFNFKKLKPVILKGNTTAIIPYRVIEKKAKPGKIHRPHGLRARLTGREHQLEKLNLAISRLVNTGTGGIINIMGEAGIGKSRLITEVKSRSGEKDLLWFEGRSRAYGQSHSYAPFVQIIKKISGVMEGDGELLSSEKLYKTIKMHLPEKAESLCHAISGLLNLKPIISLTPNDIYRTKDLRIHQIYRSCYLFLENFSRTKPVVLVFEDFHWADRSSRRLLGHIASLVQIAPLLVIIVTRPDNESERSPFNNFLADINDDFIVSLTMEPLNEEQCRSMACSILNLKRLPDEIQNIIVINSEGNPLYIEEIIRALIMRRSLFKDNFSGKWRTSCIQGRLQIPDTILGVIAHRIDRIDHELKKILKTASVIGRHFLIPVLSQTLVGEHQSLHAKLSDLVHLEFIKKKTSSPHGYMFKHSLIKEAAYKGLLITERQEIHRRTGVAIEHLFKEKPENHYGTLAYHFAEAKDWKKTIHYLFKAGDQACSMAGDAEVLNHYKKAMAAYKRIFSYRWEPFTRAQLERRMGEALFRKGDHNRAFEHFKIALQYLNKRFPRSKPGLNMATGKEICIQIVHLLMPSLFCQNKTVQDHFSEEFFLIFDAMGWIDYYFNRKRFLLIAITGLNHAERKGYLPGIVKCALGTGISCSTRGRFVFADIYNRRLKKLSEETKNPAVYGAWHLGTALREYYSSNWKQAMAFFVLSAKDYKRSGDFHKSGNCAVWAAFIMNFLGYYPESIAFSHEIIRMGRESGDNQLTGWGLHCRGANLLCIGALNRAERNLSQSLSLLKLIPDYYYGILAAKDLGRCYLKQGKTEKSIQLLIENEYLIEKQCLRGPPVALYYSTMAEAYLACAEKSQKKQRAFFLLEMKKAIMGGNQKSKRIKCIRHNAMDLMGSYHWHGGNAKKAFKFWERSLTLARESGARHDLASIHMKIGEKTGKTHHMEKASEIFSHIGARLDFAISMKALKSNQLMV